MEYPVQTNAVRFHNVEFNADGVALLSQKSKLLFVAKQDIRQITLKYGFQSERPIVEVIFGISVAGVGLYLIAASFIISSILLLLIGIWFIIDGFRRHIYFEVVLDNDRRKFPLRKKPDKKELQKFIKIASSLGYFIDAGLLDKLT